jgi:hypothetical protein
MWESEQFRVTVSHTRAQNGSTEMKNPPGQRPGKFKFAEGQGQPLVFQVLLDSGNNCTWLPSVLQKWH